MDMISVYKRDKNNLHIWENPTKQAKLWEGRVFSFIGFSHQSYSQLLSQLLSLLSEDGGSFILEEFLNSDRPEQMNQIAFFVFNYAEGLANKPIYAISANSVTPLWLVLCHEDQLKYIPSFNHFFQPNPFFNCYTQPFNSMSILLLGCATHKVQTQTRNGAVKNVRNTNDKEIIKRFLILSGAKYQSEKHITDEELEEVTHIIADKLTLRHKPLLKRIKKLNKRVISLEWLFHVYLTGQLNMEGFHIDLEGLVLEPKSKQCTVRSNLGQNNNVQDNAIFKDSTIYLSKNCQKSSLQLCEEMGCKEFHNLFLVEPTGFLNELSSDYTLSNKKGVFIILDFEDLKLRSMKDNKKRTSTDQGILDAINDSILLHKNISYVTPQWLELCKKMRQIVEITPENGAILSNNIHQPDKNKHFRRNIKLDKENTNKLGQFHALADTISYGESERSWKVI